MLRTHKETRKFNDKDYESAADYIARCSGEISDKEFDDFKIYCQFPGKEIVYHGFLSSYSEKQRNLSSYSEKQRNSTLAKLGMSPGLVALLVASSVQLTANEKDLSYENKLTYLRPDHYTYEVEIEHELNSFAKLLVAKKMLPSRVWSMLDRETYEASASTQADSLLEPKHVKHVPPAPVMPCKSSKIPQHAAENRVFSSHQNLNLFYAGSTRTITFDGSGNMHEKITGPVSTANGQSLDPGKPAIEQLGGATGPVFRR